MALDNNTAVNYTDKNTIKNWFKTGLKPTQAQFWSTWDSFWHKSESLPISSISGLGNLLDGKAEENHEHNQYAKNDATSLTADNVTAWQQKLGVADLKFDDQAITTTQDYADFGLQAGATINAFNNAIYQSVGNKLDAPTEEGTTTDYPYVVGVNDENEPIKLPAGDLGKNFSNTDLEITENRKHTGTAIVELAMPMVYSNASQRFSGLVDKSSDATYNVFPILDGNGNLAKASKPFFAFKNFLTQCTIAESTELGQLLNGGQGGAGAISVESINPPVIPKENNNIYIVLRGANLNLNQTDFSISIVDKNSSALIKSIPNSQVQLATDGLRLTFYFNPNDIPNDEYKIKITSGVKVFVTSLNLKIVDNIEYINVNTITWSSMYASDYTNTLSGASGANVNIIQEGIAGHSSDYKIAFKSEELFAVGENFVIELNTEISRQNSDSADSSLTKTHIGLMYSDINLSLIPSTSVSYNFWKNGSYGSRWTFNNNQTQIVRQDLPRNQNVVIIKNGNLFTMITGGVVTTTTLTNNQGYSIGVFYPKYKDSLIVNITVQQAYKF